MPYTPGYSEQTLSLMARRTLCSHGAFVLPWLKPDLTMLDLGCGPGSITLDLARQVPQGRIVGIDRAESQVALALASAARLGITNAEFRVGEADDVQNQEHEFDLIFCHALFEHLSDPLSTLRHLRTLLRHRGRVALRSPDWGGWVLHPETTQSSSAIAAYGHLQRSNGGDIHAGRKLGSWLAATGFQDITVSASYEIYPSAAMIAGYIGNQLDQADMKNHAESLRAWSLESGALFAQAWFEAVGQRN